MYSCQISRCQRLDLFLRELDLSLNRSWFKVKHTFQSLSYSKSPNDPLISFNHKYQNSPWEKSSLSFHKTRPHLCISYFVSLWQKTWYKYLKGGGVILTHSMRRFSLWIFGSIDLLRIFWQRKCQEKCCALPSGNTVPKRGRKWATVWYHQGSTASEH